MYLVYILTICCCLLFNPCQAQECNELLFYKTDQYYTNVKSKPDSLRFLNCSYVQRKLKANDVFVDIMETTMNAVPIFVATIIKNSGTPVVIEIPKQGQNASQKELEYSLANLNRGIIVPDKIKKQALDYAKYENFLAYLDPYLDNVKTFYYSTSDVLNLMNLKFFKTKEGVFLFEKYLMIRLHSAASFLGNHHNLILPKRLNVLLIGDLLYECSDVGKPRKTPQYRTTWGYLSGTNKEVRTIFSLLQGNHKVELLDSCLATEKKVVSLVNASPYDVLHFATHGFYFKENNPEYGVWNNSYPLLKSGIVLSGANSIDATLEALNEYGLFTAVDFLAMNISNIKLVVLSTCHSGEGENTQSEAPLGLTLALLRQGINAMMISNRAVPDKGATQFMTTFYKYLNQVANVDECFTNTLKELVKADPKTDWSFFDLVH